MPPITIGSCLAHFRIERLLGKGGMGAVYLAQDEKLERPVALKVIHPALADDDRYRRRLLREARAAAAVSHGNIATVYEVDEADGQLYIAMEYVPGPSLADALDDGALSLPRAIGIAIEIAAALEKAHAAGVVHRDLKPENTVLTEEGGVKVLDFGIARLKRPDTGEQVAAPQDNTALTVEGTVMGTPGYMSPEQALGLELDHRTDIFALGVMLYEMLTGRPPFAHRTPLEAAVSVTRDEPPPLSTLCAQAPAWVQRLVHRCLAKDPAERYPTATDLQAALAQREPETSPTTGAATGETAEPPPRGRRRRWVGAVPLSLAALLLAVVALRDDRPVPPPSEPPSGTTTSGRAKTATAITALPDPRSSAPEAIAAYRRALQAFRDGNWPLAAKALDQAVALDPNMAAAHMRLVLVRVLGHNSPNARQHFRKAAVGRATLDDRDRALFDALEPLAAREPADLKEATERIAVAASKHPTDAELAMLHAVLLQRTGKRDASLVPAQRAVELDPNYADGWQAVALAHAALGRMNELAVALDRCVEAAPTAIDCLYDRIALRSAQGKCAAVVADAKNAIARSPRSGSGHRCLAMGLASLGEPIESVATALAGAAPHYPQRRRTGATLEDELRLKLLAGAFDEAEQAAKALAAHHSENAKTQWLVARQLVAIHYETSRPGKAAQIAQQFFESQNLWGTPPSGHALWDSTPQMLRTLLAAGDIDAKQLDERRGEWIARWGRRGTAHQGEIWLGAYGVPARTAAEAKQAIELRPPDFEPIQLFRIGNVATHFGQLYFLAGDLDQAHKYLLDGTSQCRLLYDPIPHLQAYELLGRVYEARKETEQACRSYATVLGRWGQATPRSVTATRARKRFQALHCPPL